MALEISQEGIVVTREIADIVVQLRRGEDDGLRVVGEFGERGPVLLRFDLFGVGAVMAVVYLQRVGLAEEQELAGCVKVERCVGRRSDGGGSGLEQLARTISFVGPIRIEREDAPTRVGRKLAITSLTLATGASFSFSTMLPVVSGS